ncbi:hypothetical protein V7O62_02065 [Methanolobus sp. ZRKC2]|uniref:hypothetical protein n=1 Tax=Methanolobus sp. ZRKC2 TaxID=3125783 RepID=UPI00324E61A4
MNLRTNNKVNNSNINKNEVDFDTEVLNYLDLIGYIRRRQLVNDLMSAHKGERGYSQKSIDRKLGILVKTGQVLILKNPEELERYGIDREDGKASYFVSKLSSEIKTHIDNVIDILKSENEIDIKEALIEIENYEQSYALTPSHLDLLVENLNTENTDLVDHLLRILYKYVIDIGREPANKEAFTQMLKRVLMRYPSPIKGYINLRTGLIHLLGYYEDEIVINQLRADAKTISNLDTVMNDYRTKCTASIIEKHRTDLFDFKRELKKQGNDEAAKFIGVIRYDAITQCGLNDRKMLLLDNNMKEWQNEVDF